MDQDIAYLYLPIITTVWHVKIGTHWYPKKTAIIKDVNRDDWFFCHAVNNASYRDPYLSNVLDAADDAFNSKDREFPDSPAKNRPEDFQQIATIKREFIYNGSVARYIVFMDNYIDEDVFYQWTGETLNSFRQQVRQYIMESEQRK